MAQVFLGTGETFNISNNNTQIFGAAGTGSEAIVIASGITGVTVDSAVERVALSGASSAYTYQQSGVNLLVYSGATLVATVPLQNDTNGTQLTFTNGTVNVIVNSSGMTFGGATVSATAAGAVTPTTIDAAVTSPAIGGGTVAGQTFTLTTGIDNVTNAFSTVNAIIDQSGTAGNTTWGLVDTVATSANGVVNLKLLSTGAGATAGYSTAGVTTLNIQGIDVANTAATNSFDVAGMTGLTNVSVANSSVIGTTADTLSVTSIANGATLSLNSNGQYQNVTGNWVSAATAGTADTVSLNLAGRNGAVTVGTGFETTAIATTGTGARAASLTTTTTKAVTVTGTDLYVDAALDTTVTSFDASTATGVINVAITPGTTLTAKGGTGTSDVISLSSLGATTTLTGFETLVATAASTFDLTTATGVTKLGVNVGAGSVAFTNAAATQNTISLSSTNQRTTAADTTSSLTTGGSLGYALKNATGVADALTLAVDNGGVASTGTFTVGGAVTANGIESINLTTANFKAVTIGGFNDAVTGTGNLTFKASGAANLTLGTIAISSGLATGTDIVDFSAVTGTVSATITDATNNLTFTGGSGVTTMTTADIAAGKTAAYTFGGAADVITLTPLAAAGTLTVVAGAGDDTIQWNAATAGTTATLQSIDGGTGTDTLRVFGTANSKVLNATIASVEKISLEATAAVTTLNLTVASGYADTVGIVDVSGQTETISFTTASSGGNISLANVTALGWTNGTDVLALNGIAGNEILTGSSTLSTTITGNGGADAINLGATHTGAGKVVMAAIADSGTFAVTVANAAVTTSTFDVITNVKALDVLNFALYTTGTANATAATGLFGLAAGAITAATSNSLTLADNTLQTVRGTYTAGSFVGATGGADLMVVYDANSATSAQAYEAIVLVGAGSLTATYAAATTGATITFS